MYKNRFNIIQNLLFIFVGNVPNKIKNILEKFKDLSIKDTLKSLNKSDRYILEEYYGKKWYHYFFTSKHLARYMSMKGGGDEDEDVEIIFEEDEEDSAVEKVEIDENVEIKEDIDDMEREQDSDAEEDFSVTKNVKLKKNEFELIKYIEDKMKYELMDFPKTYDNQKSRIKMVDVINKHYIYHAYIHEDDVIQKVLNNICFSIRMDKNIYNDGGYYTPKRLYLWANNESNKTIPLTHQYLYEKFPMEYPVIPPAELNEFETMTENVKALYNKFKYNYSRIQFESLENTTINDFNIKNNEIYAVDIYNQLGVKYSNDPVKTPEQIKNLYDLYIKLFFPNITNTEFKSIIQFLNKNDEEERIYMYDKYTTLSIESKIYNYIMDDTRKIDYNIMNKLMKNLYITQSVVNLRNNENISGKTLNLKKIFNLFKTDAMIPFVQYQESGKTSVYKFYKKSLILGKDILKKWFDTNIYGLSFRVKIKINNIEKFVNIILYSNGRIEYKTQWGMNDNMKIEDIERTFPIITQLVSRIKRDTHMEFIKIPTLDDYEFVSMNVYQRFDMPKKATINHNLLTELAIYFFPYVAIVVDPKKRKSKKLNNLTSFGKSGTYLRYKRMTNYLTQTNIESRILYLLRNFEDDMNIIAQISKEFNITDGDAQKYYTDTKNKYINIKKTRKVLRKIETINRYKQSGIEINILGMKKDDYSIKINGAKNRSQLAHILQFCYSFLTLYYDIHILKNSKSKLIKLMINRFTNVARRIGYIKNIEDNLEVKDEFGSIKAMTNIDRERLGIQKIDGESLYYSRLCQKEKQPRVITSDEEMKKMGYQWNATEKNYVLNTTINGANVTLKPVIFYNEQLKKDVYYVCYPGNNDTYIYTSFINKDKHPEKLCMPCCYATDHSVKKNNSSLKKNYDECTGTFKKKDELQFSISKDILYIVQDFGKQGRLNFLPPQLNILLNTIDNNEASFSGKKLTKSDNHLFILGINQLYQPFLTSIAVCLDVNADELLQKIVDFIYADNDELFRSLDNGNIKAIFGSKENYLKHLASGNNIKHEYLLDLISLPGIITTQGINIYIFNRRRYVMKKQLDKDIVRDEFYLLCPSRYMYHNYFKEGAVNILLMKRNKSYNPIVSVTKDSSDLRIKTYIDNENILSRARDLLDINCSSSNILGIISNVGFMSNDIYSKLNNIKSQVINTIDQVLGFMVDNFYIPVVPSSLIPFVSINEYNRSFIDRKIDDVIKYYNSVDFLKNNYEFLGVVVMGNKYDLLIMKNGLQVPLYPEVVNKKYLRDNNLTIIEDYEELQIDKYIRNDEAIMDRRLKMKNERLFMLEHYQILRYEIYNYFKNNKSIKKDIIDILEENTDDKIEKVKKIIEKIINRISTVVNKYGVMSNFLISNNRQLCENVRNNEHCERGKFKILKGDINKYILMISNELLYKDIERRELLGIDRYGIENIINNDLIEEKEDEIIVKDMYNNIEKLFMELYGENYEGTKKRRKILMNEENEYLMMNENYPLIKGRKVHTQPIIHNNDTLFRAVANGYFWIKSDLYDDNTRNLGYYSILQTKLGLFIKNKFLKFINMEDNYGKIVQMFNPISKINNMQIKKYYNSLINTISTGTSCLLELLVISHIFSLVINVYYVDMILKYVFDDGKVQVGGKKRVDGISIFLEKNSDSDIPNQIYVLYDIK